MRKFMVALTGVLLAGSAAAAQEISKDTGQVFVPLSSATLVHRMPAADFKPTAAYRWLDFTLEASGRDAVRNKPRPTVLSRTDAIVLTAMYDAWAAYDDKAVGTRLGGKLRRPKAERTQANKEKAIAYATYRALLFVYDEDADWIREQFKARGFDPANVTTDVRTPEGVGNVAANALIAYRRRDGANQLGDEPGGDGKPYSDYTGYKPVNTAATSRIRCDGSPSPSTTARGARCRRDFSARNGGGSRRSASIAPTSSVPPSRPSGDPRR